MTRRAKILEQTPTEFTVDTGISGDGAFEEDMPSDALNFHDFIEARFRQLLRMSTDPKDLTKALEAATQWVKVRGEQDGMQNWGAGLKATMKP